MMKRTLLSATALRTAAFAGAGLMLCATASAQTAPQAPATPQPDVVDCPDQNQDGVCDPPSTLTSADGSTPTTAGNDEIVVTGSRIRRDTFSSIEPITVVTAEEITQSGFNSATDALQSTEITAGAGQINNFFGGFVTAGGTGANTLGLRNLGPARTLILLNGRRLAPAGTRGNVVAADLNVLPTAIVERIEVLKAGASSIYGSDAVAGVVNIITDARERGVTVDAQVNVPEIGAGVDRRISTTFGIGNSRLDLIGSFEWRKRDSIRLRDVDFARCPVGGALTGEGTAFGSGDTAGFNGSTCFTLDNGGVTINTVGVPNRQAIGRTSGTLATFNRLIPDPTVTTGPTPGFRGVGFYDRDTFDPASQEEQVVTPVEILTGFLSADYELEALGDAELYGEVLATRRKSSSLLYRQLSLDYVRGSPLVPEIFRNGTFLNPSADGSSAGQPIAARAFIGFGLTDSAQKVDYVRVGGGLRGDFALPGWRYDAYVGRSFTDGTYEIESFLIDRIAQSIVVNQNANGTFTCASIAVNPDCVAAPPLNAATISGNLPQTFRDYILVNTIGTTKFRETTASFAVDGPVFALPGGDVQLALGAEYRKQSINDTPDPNSVSGNLLGLTAGSPTRGSDNVKEVFGEVFLPILRDLPFVRNLSLNASARYTDYKSYGSDTTYKIAGEWEFLQGIGFRGSYGTSYRAPALSEQFLGATSGFLGSGNDPCDADNFPRANGQPNPGAYTPVQQQRAANCASIGLDVATFQQNSGITIFNRGGAETGLSAETSKNWSVGFVAQRTLPNRMSIGFAVDYFDIEVNNGVSSLGGGTILNRCYNATDFDPTEGFCRFVQRDANNILTVTSGFVNLSTDIVKGYEFEARFATPLAGGTLTLNGNLTKYTEQSDRLFPEEFLLDSNGIVTVPDLVGTFDANYRRGPLTFFYGLSYIQGSSGTYDFFATSRQTGQVNASQAQSFRDNFLLEVPDYFLHTASVRARLVDNFEFTFGVRNLFDKQPPRISNAGFNTTANAPIYSGYDFTGRQFFVNTSFKFR